jgi:hypothetical protein
MWNSLKWSKLALQDCDLTASQWSFVPMNGLNLTSCIIDNIRVEMMSLRGVTVTSQQALMLAGMLGIKISDGF